MMNLPFIATGEHRPRPPSRLLFGEGEMEYKVVQIRLDTHCEGVIRSSALRDGVGLLSPWSLKDRKGDGA